MRQRVLAYFSVCTSLLFSLGISCGGGGDQPPCDPVAQSGCESGQICEDIQGGGTGCFEPVSVRASVVDLETGQALVGIQVVALDANGSPISGVCTTDVNGICTLSVSLTRDANGNTVETIFLRADGAGYLSFPGGARPPFPVNTAGAQVDANGVLVLDPALTKVALIALPDPGACQGSISGSAENPIADTGVLVVAETTLAATPCGMDPETPGFAAGSLHGFTAIADKDSGQYKIFNLPSGSYAVAGYAKGANYNSDPNPVDLAGAQNAVVNLSIRDENTATASGNVEFANAPNTDESSVVFIVESTLIQVNTQVVIPDGGGTTVDVPILLRGESVPGLRQVVTQNASSFEAEGVPAGNYVVLAAFENDEAVRDPDVCIGGTQVQHIALDPGEAETLEGFKITDALTNPDPDANELVVPDPIFSWDDDSSEEAYYLFLFDGFARKIWEKKDIPGVSGESRVSVDYGDGGDPVGGVPLESGQFYQFRVMDIRFPGGGGDTSKQCPISMTEDFRGVFEVQ